MNLEPLLAISGSFLFLCMGMALPMIVILSATYLIIKRRHYSHLERMKMIECGLVREEADFVRAASGLRRYEHSIFFEIGFYGLLLFLGFLFVLYSTYAVFYFAILKMAVEGGLVLFALLGGVLLTIILTLLIRFLPRFYNQRRFLLFSCLFLGLSWDSPGAGFLFVN